MNVEQPDCVSGSFLVSGKLLKYFLLLVLLSPLVRQGTPVTVAEIEARILELSFSANFMREMRMFARAINFSTPRFLSFGMLERKLQKMQFHMIDSNELAS